MAQNIYTGFHAVEERVRRSVEEKSCDKCHIFYSKPGPRIKKIISLAKQSSIVCEETDDRTLDQMVMQLPVQARDHRGIILTVEGEKQNDTAQMIPQKSERKAETAESC